MKLDCSILALLLSAVQVSGASGAWTNAATEFKLLSQVPAAQVSPIPASAAVARGVLRLSTVHVTYSGISATWAQRMARVLTEARSNAQSEFGFNMPETISLTVTVATNLQYELFDDMRDQVTYHLHSEADLANFEDLHWYFLYGLSHEVAHLAMYRTLDPRLGKPWLNWDAQEAWAHYFGGRLADMSYAQCAPEFWPGRQLESKQALQAEREPARNFFPLSERQLGEYWRALANIVGDRGIEPLLESWSKADINPRHPAVAVSRTFTGHPKAQELQGWWLKAAPLMLTQPGKGPFPPTRGQKPSSGPAT
jgi:hypothetical protein